MLPDRIRLPMQFDAAALHAELQRACAPGPDWIAHFVPQNYRGDWDVLPLRGTAGATHPILMITAHPGAEFADTPFLDRLPLHRAALAAFACPLESVRLMRLSAGSTILVHCDPHLDPESGTVRLHVPITTHSQVDFRLAGTRVVMDAGSCWYLDLTRPHAVDNRGDTDRIHLVIDAQVNAWLAALLARACADQASSASA